MGALLAFLLVPVITGAASGLWAPIAKLSWTGMAALNALSAALVLGISFALRRDEPGVLGIAREIGWWPLVVYVALSVGVSFAWFAAHRETHVVWIAVGEMAWPACVLVATLVLARCTDLPVQAPTIVPWHLLWGALIVVGVVGLAVTEVRS